MCLVRPKIQYRNGGEYEPIADELLRLLIPFSIPSVLSAYSFIRRSTPIQKALAEIPEDTVIYQVAEVPMNMNALAASPLQNEASGISIWSILWIAGVILCAFFFAISYLRCHLEFRASLPVSNEYAGKWFREHPSQ